MVKLLFLVSLNLLVCAPGRAATYPRAQDRAGVSHRTHRHRGRQVDDDAVVNVIARNVKKVGVAVDCSVGNCSAPTDNGKGPDQPLHFGTSISSVKSPPMFGINPQPPRNVYSTGRPAIFSPPTARFRFPRRGWRSSSVKSRQSVSPVKQEKLAGRSLPTRLITRQRRRRCCCRCCRRRH